MYVTSTPWLTYKTVLQGSVQKLTSQLEKMQQQKADSEAALKETIKQNERAIAKLTSEKESLEKEVAQLKKKNQVWCGSVLNLRVGFFPQQLTLEFIAECISTRQPVIHTHTYVCTYVLVKLRNVN